VLGAGEFGEMHLQAFSLMHREGQTELVGMAGVNPAPPDVVIVAVGAQRCDLRVFST